MDTSTAACARARYLRLRRRRVARTSRGYSGSTRGGRGRAGPARERRHRDRTHIPLLGDADAPAGEQHEHERDAGVGQHAAHVRSRGRQAVDQVGQAGDPGRPAGARRGSLRHVAHRGTTGHTRCRRPSGPVATTTALAADGEGQVAEPLEPGLSELMDERTRRVCSAGGGSRAPRRRSAGGSSPPHQRGARAGKWDGSAARRASAATTAAPRTRPPHRERVEPVVPTQP